MLNQVQQQFEDLLEAEVDRREFLAYCGAALLGILGVSGLINALTRAPRPGQNSAAGGYGSSTYGGKR